MSRQSVKDFYERLATDQHFQNQIQSVKSKDECSQIVKSAGYDFTPAEFEEYNTQVLQGVASEEELETLDEKELANIFGGFMIAPLYGNADFYFPHKPNGIADFYPLHKPNPHKPEIIDP